MNPNEETRLHCSGDPQRPSLERLRRLGRNQGETRGHMSHLFVRILSAIAVAAGAGCAEPNVGLDTQHSTAGGIYTVTIDPPGGTSSTSGEAETAGHFPGTTDNSDASSVSDAGGTSTPSDDSATDVSFPDLPGETCEVLQIEGESVLRPVDILFAIDTSGSMAAETQSVVANMNAFSQLIADSGADARVVLIAAPSMCIAPPLGSGQCAGNDDNPDRFVHLDVTVGSHDALEKILATAPQWKPQLRPDGATHVVVISDDDSSMKLVEFHTKLSALGPGLSDYTFHAIVSSVDPDTSECDQEPACCDLTADKGLVYLQLVAKTGGVFGNLCDQDFTPVFAALAEKIVESAPISCTWALPNTGQGYYDYDAASVRYALNGADFSTMAHVAHPGMCPQGQPAWHYDDPENPTGIAACPWTCSYLANSAKTRVDIELQCLPQPQG